MTVITCFKFHVKNQMLNATHGSTPSAGCKVGAKTRQKPKVDGVKGFSLGHSSPVYLLAGGAAAGPASLGPVAGEAATACDNGDDGSSGCGGVRPPAPSVQKGSINFTFLRPPSPRMEVASMRIVRLRTLPACLMVRPQRMRGLQKPCSADVHEADQSVKATSADGPSSHEVGGSLMRSVKAM